MPEFRCTSSSCPLTHASEPTVPRRRTGKPHVYVGETKKTPEERLADHRAGGFTRGPSSASTASVCSPDLYRAMRVCRTRTESRAAEARLAARLRRRGHCVFGGH